MGTLVPILAQSGGSSGNFLVTPSLGVMIWTILSFVLALVLLRKYAFPRIAANLDRRQRAIEESIDAAERTKTEAEQLLDEYRQRLHEARDQADEIVQRARQSAESTEREAQEEARKRRDQMMEQTKRDIEAETRRAIQQIRGEVADLTILATEKVTRKSLDQDDQRRLVEEALGELDFSALGAGRDS